MSNFIETGSEAQHPQQNTFVSSKPYGKLIAGFNWFKSILFITENDLVVCLFNAHGILIVPLIEYLT